MPAHTRKPVHRKVKAVALVATFLSAFGAALAAAGAISWQVVLGAAVTGATATFAGYQKRA